MKTILTFGTISLISTLTRLSGAAPNLQDLPLAEPKVKSLAVFKNGLGFVVKSGETPLKEGWVRVAPLPAATLGTLWIGTTDKSAPVTDIVAYKERIKEEQEAISLAELLAANVGKEAVVTYQMGNSVSTIEGTILGVPEHRRTESEESGDRLDRLIGGRLYSPWDATGASGAVAPGQIVLMRISRGGGAQRTVTLNKSLIQSVEFTGNPTLTTRLEKERHGAKVRVGGNRQTANITLSYLEKGLVWSPSYRLDIRKEKVATLALDAVLANDTEDLDEVEVSFVVGYPHFLFADAITPLSPRQSVASFVEALARGGPSDRSGRFANVMAQSVAFNTANYDTSTPAVGDYSVAPPLPGEANQDLFSYRKDKVSLKKGDRASFTVFETEVPYEHLYEWIVPDSMNVDDAGNRRSNREDVASYVWHVLRIENKSNLPWTTAPAFALDDGRPLAQEVLKYTPPGAKNTLRLTVAVDVRSEQSQIEANRRQVSIAGRSYDEVTVDGTLKLSSRKKEAIRLVVRKALVGEVVSARDNGKTTRVARSLTAANPNSEIEWEFTLPSGETRELAYQYKVLINR